MHTHGDGLGRKQRFKERLEILRDSALHRQVREHLSAGRWTRRQWIHASLFTTIGIMIATIVPGFSAVTQVPAAEPYAVLSLDLPELSSARQAGVMGDSWQVVKVKSGQTLSSLFEDLGIPKATLHRILENADAKTALARKLKPGTELAFDLPVAGGLRSLRYDRDADHRVELTLDGDKLKENVIARETATRTVVLSGKVGRSLNRSARKAGLTAANINSLTDDIFKYDIDFDSDVGANDRFSVLVEQSWREGELIDTGPVLAATFTAGGKLHSGFRFLRNGKPEYFTSDGRPLKRAFIRMPIPYARLSSSFGARKHPVLGRMRMHKGVDYAAGTGTPIQAAGDARVQSVGWQGGYGRAVVLDHGHGYTTLYGHMSRFGNIRQGQMIPQGTIIGYVGSTGMSTGPHLHYEFRINGVHRNPLSITMPPPQPLQGAELASFRTETYRAMTRIRTVENIVFPAAIEGPQQALAIALETPPGRKQKKKG